MTEPTPATDTLDPIDTSERGVHCNTRPYQVLAWVGIIAGILFIVAVVFFSGFFAARATGGYGWHRGHQSAQMGPDGMAPGGPRPSTPPLVDADDSAACRTAVSRPLRAQRA